MKLFNPKSVNLNKLPLEMRNFPIEKGRAPTLDHFNGEGSQDPVYNAIGCKALLEVVLAQTHFSNQYILATKVGGKWRHLGEIVPSDPGIQQLLTDKKLTAYGPSPDDVARREAYEAERKAIEATAAHEAAERSRINKERADKAEAQRLERAASRQ